jgi:lipopolysaccharide cholinephosphotransferase
MVRDSTRKALTTRSARGAQVADLSNCIELSQTELRAAQTEILNSFANFCESNGLSYFLYAGTLLGAVRHQGYIPWDDDIDIAMPRRDYNRLHSIAAAPGSINGFSLCSPSVTPGFPWPFTKIANNPDTLSVEANNDIGYRIGLNIDIFPLDGWPTGAATRWVHALSLRLLRALMYSHHLPRRLNRSNLSESILVLAKPIAKHISLNWLIRKTSSHASRYSMEDSGLAGVLVWGYPELVSAQAYSQIAALPFEQRYYRAPSGYDAVLSAKYGSYLQLPPPDLQVSHHSIQGFRSSAASVLNTDDSKSLSNRPVRRPSEAKTTSRIEFK